MSSRVLGEEVGHPPAHLLLAGDCIESELSVWRCRVDPS